MTRLREFAVCLTLACFLAARSALGLGLPPIIIGQPATQSVLEQGTASFSVSAISLTTMTYQWSKGGAAISGATSSSYAITDVQATDAGTYSVKIVNGGGSATSANATLTVDLPPAITTQPQNQMVIQGDDQSASFSVVATGTASLSYQWYMNGSRLSPDKNSSLTINNPKSDKAGSYTVVVKNDWGSVTSAVATLRICVPPSIQTQPSGATVTQGQNATFSVVANGSAPFAYQWNLNGSALSGETNAAVTLIGAQPTQAGSYTVVVTNSAGSITSQVAALTVNIPPAIATQPQGQTLIQGQNQNISFSVAVSGTAPFAYQWNFNGSAISGETNAALTLIGAQPTQAGSYTVVVTNNFGGITSQVATLTVYVPPSITTQPQNQSATQGVSPAASFSIVAAGSGPLNYQWYWNNSPAAQETNSTLTLNEPGTNQAGSYTVVVQNNWGAVTSAVVVLTIYVPPAITNPPQSLAVFRGQSAAFSVTAIGSTPLTYQWSLNDSALAADTNATLILTNVAALQAGSYTVVVSNPGGSVTSAIAILTVNNPVAAVSLPAGAGPTASGFSFQVAAPVGVTYVILASSDFQTWTPIATNVATNAATLFTDPTAGGPGNQFYKIITP